MVINILLAISTLLTTWQFRQEPSPQMPDVDTTWHTVSIPHDWAISGSFDRANDLQEVVVAQNGEKEPTWKTGRSGGLPWMGKGHYRTRIAVNKEKFYTLVFDGAMSHADVYVNGEEVVYWPYGYNTFDCYILPRLITGDSVDIDVYLENKPQQSRWYPGAGLYRNVHLVETDPVHIPTFGVLVRTPEINPDKAQVELWVEVQNGVEEYRVQNTEYRVQTDIYYDNQFVGKIEGLHGTCNILNPHLWSPETPHIYTARTRVLKPSAADGQPSEIVDERETRFGIRALSYTPEHGFRLNGKTRKFKGVCLHHDLGPLGAAIHKDALRHQLTMLKDMGCDAIRTSHNMPAPELVELCDEMGMMMMIEPFDVWNHGKTENDYSVEFNDWWRADITNMVKHYRNNASVMLWSSGNEVWNQVLPDGISIVTDLQALFHQLDPTRPVTNGMDQAKQVIHNGFGAAVELPGFNYRTSRYVEGYENLPQKMILGSETASTVSSRGVYKLPALIQPDALYNDQQSSGYDMEYCAWSGLPEQDFQLQDDYDWTLGQFVWTGFDYLGEPSPYDTDAWPSHSSYFGIIDLASLPKDRYWLYRSQWNKQDETLHVLPHWNWKKGDKVAVFCYTSYPEAELFVGRKSYGRLRFATKEEAEQLAQGTLSRPTASLSSTPTTSTLSSSPTPTTSVSSIPTTSVSSTASLVSPARISAMPKVGEFEIPEWGSAPRPDLLPRYRLMWFDVPYKKKSIKVIAYDENGNEVARRFVFKAGKPDHLEVVWANERENPEELCYMTVRVVDKKGNLCPFADNLIRYEGEGYVAAANGNAACLDSFVQPQMHAFAGQCTFIIKKGAQGSFTLVK